MLLTRTSHFVPLSRSRVVALRGTAAIGWRWWAFTVLSFGVAAAERIWRVVESPTRRGDLTFVARASIAAPAFNAVIDLVLHACTP